VLLALTYGARNVAAQPNVTFERLELDGPLAGQVEISGIVKSQQFDDVWWVHNDSGNAPKLFAVESDGTTIRPPWVDELDAAGIDLRLAANIDWEDIALADGWLYLADIGNNGNARRDLGIYVLPEPNPRVTTKMRALWHLSVVYPDQTQFPPKKWHYDAEAVFFHNSTLFVLTKHRRDGQWDRLARGTNLYALDLSNVQLDRPNTLTLVDHYAKPAAPTAADLSPDGKWLAVLTVRRLWFFPNPGDNGQWLSADPKRTYSVALPDNIGQAEAVAWDSATRLAIVTEGQGAFYRVTVSDLK
jgi:hypothetical protein